MVVVTVFLAVLILALFLGNVFLSLTSPRRLQRQFQMPLAVPNPPGLGVAPVQGFAQGHGHATGGPLSDHAAFEEQAGRERVRYLARRLDRLEQVLLRLDSSKVLAQKLGTTVLSKKMNDYTRFREKTVLEIAALKQRLDKIQPVSQKSKAMGISDEKLRDLVFRAGN